jgi:hypothetical protein
MNKNMLAVGLILVVMAFASVSAQAGGVSVTTIITKSLKGLAKTTKKPAGRAAIKAGTVTAVAGAVSAPMVLDMGEEEQKGGNYGGYSPEPAPDPYHRTNDLKLAKPYRMYPE